MQGRVSEEQFCEAFADGLASSEEFRSWVLGRCGFAVDSSKCRLLDREQLEARSSEDALWWQYWHYERCRCDGCSGKETDIFAVFECSGEQNRFALHVECKLAAGRFTSEKQAPGYPLRAECWAGKERFLNYKSFKTVLLAPGEFLDPKKKANAKGARFFDCILLFDEIADRLSAFANLIEGEAE